MLYSRSAKPKSRPERKSMTEERFNSLGQTSENNNKSPKTRRSTFIRDILKRKGFISFVFPKYK